MSNLGVTAEDRKFAAQILEDFGTFEEGIADQEKLAQWVRNIRHAAERKTSQFCPTCKKHVPSPCVARQNTVGCPNLAQENKSEAQ